MRPITRFVIVAILSVYFLPTASSAGLFGGGGSNQSAPDIVKSGEPVTVQFYLNTIDTWGSRVPIKERYTNLVLHYRLESESNYKTVLPQEAPLPDNYRRAISKTIQWEACQFIIPPYPRGTSGNIEYYIDMTFDGYPNKAPGLKKIKLISIY